MGHTIQRTTRLTVLPDKEPIFCEMATNVSIVDEMNGEFVKVEQCMDSGVSKIQINPEEWPVLRAAINRMIKQCRGVKKNP